MNIQNMYYLTVESDETNLLGGHIYTDTIPVMTGQEVVEMVLYEKGDYYIFSDGFIYDEQGKKAGVYIQVSLDSDKLSDKRYELYTDQTISISLPSVYYDDYFGFECELVHISLTLQRMHAGHPDFSKFLNLGTVFKHENIGLLFEEAGEKGSYIAGINDLFSKYMEKNEFSRKWAKENFPAGTYIITVYRKCSVCRNGRLVWRNEYDLGEIDHDSRLKKPCFVIILDHKMDYTVPVRWMMLDYNTVYAVPEEKEPLEAKVFHDLELAEREAKECSENGYKAAVMECVEFYDMGS